MKVDFTGTVSHATMLPSDLIPSFMDVLERYVPGVAAQIRKEYSDVFAALQTGADSVNYPELHTTLGTSLRYDIDYLVWEILPDELDTIAPHGHYFGSHPGNGSDYGYWEIGENDVY